MREYMVSLLHLIKYSIIIWLCGYLLISFFAWDLVDLTTMFSNNDHPAKGIIGCILRVWVLVSLIWGYCINENRKRYELLRRYFIGE